MGLDMYLNAKRYLSPYNENEKTVIEGIEKVFDSRGMKVKQVVCEAMYWRKANAIHRWFVENVQSDNDDCGYYPVSCDELANLLVTVKDVLADTSRAEELLPTQEGFFFGSTDYDEWYFKDLEETKEKLEGILSWASTKDGIWWDFEYHSSW